MAENGRHFESGDGPGNEVEKKLLMFVKENWKNSRAWDRWKRKPLINDVYSNLWSGVPLFCVPCRSASLAFCLVYLHSTVTSVTCISRKGDPSRSPDSFSKRCVVYMALFSVRHGYQFWWPSDVTTWRHFVTRWVFLRGRFFFAGGSNEEKRDAWSQVMFIVKIGTN